MRRNGEVAQVAGGGFAAAQVGDDPGEGFGGDADTPLYCSTLGRSMVEPWKGLPRVLP